MFSTGLQLHMAPPTKENITQSFKTPQTQGFKVKAKGAAYKFGTFTHWVFFKPNNLLSAEDPAQTSDAPVLPQDAGASAADAGQDSSMKGRTMAATRDMVSSGGPSDHQVANHQDPHSLHK